MFFFRREYFTYSNSPNVQQLIDGFNIVFNYLASALQPQTSMANIMPVPMKTAKLDKAPTQSKSSSSTMSIFPTANKPHPSLTTSPSKPSVVSPSISTTITPVPSSQSLLKSASTVISVGSGQLTITPSISITPNPPTKPTSVLPQMPAPSFNIQKPMQPKVRRSTGDKPTKASQKIQRLSQGSNIFSDLPPITVENLPKSLSIIPSSSFVPTKPGAISPINIGALTNKPVKVPKPKKKSIDGNKNAAQAKKLTPQMTGIDPNLLKKSLTSQQLQSLNPLMSQYNYLSHYQQFLTGVPTTTLQLPKPQKSKTSTVTSAGTQQQKAAIKVKQLDQLQGRATKVNEKLAPKSKQQPFSTPNIAANSMKNPPVAKSPTVLNAYGTTISSITHGAQSIPTSFSSLPTAAAAANLPGSLQIR